MRQDGDYSTGYCSIVSETARPIIGTQPRAVVGVWQLRPDEQPERNIMSRNAELAKIHMGKKQLGLDDDTYRAMLEDMFGVSSAGKLDYKQRYRLLRHLEERGAVFTTKQKASAKVEKDFYVIPDNAPHVHQKRYILALWKKLGWKMSGVDTRMKKQFGVDSFVWLNDQAALQTIAKDLVKRCQARGIDVE